MIDTKRKILVTILSALIILAFAVTANAYVLPDNKSGKGDSQQSEKCREKHHDKYHKLSKSILLQNLGLTKEDVKAARKSGKSIIDLAKEKGKTLDQIKAAMIDAKTKAISEAIKDGKISKEEGDKKLTKIKDKISNWDGTVKHKNKE